MNIQLPYAAMALVGPIFGFLVAWLYFRQKHAADIANATTHGAHAAELAQVELQAVREKLSTLQNIEAELGQKTQQLSEIAAQRAGLEEMSRQIPDLKSRIATLEQAIAESAAENANLRQRTGELTAELTSERTQAAAGKDEILNTKRMLSTTTDLNAAKAQELSAVSSQKAALEEAARQIPDLKSKIAAFERTFAAANSENAELRETTGRLAAELEGERNQLSAIRVDLTKAKADLESASAELSTRLAELAEVRTKLDSERKGGQEKLALLVDAKQALSDQFKTIAAEILEDKSKRFSEQNITSLGQLLDPLRQKLTDFQAKIEDVYIKEGKERSTLAEQVRQLMDLNQMLSEDAKNLTRALKGSSKSQGNWGELVLERVLEASGLRKGEEYIVQVSHTRDDGTRVVPDVVVRLPEDRNLVVDSKVSLNAYEEYANSEDDGIRSVAAARHLESVRSHIRTLSERNYQSLYSLPSLDFVLMFVPIEPAFMVAISTDRELFMDAWKQNVLLVSPSTLLFVVRTVAHLWRQEAQNRNAQDIAKRGADLYDKLVGFIEDMTSLGRRLNQAQKDYEQAFTKLTGGRGLVRQAERLRELGVKPSKSLPSTLVERARDNEESVVPLPHGVSGSLATDESLPAVSEDVESQLK